MSEASQDVLSSGPADYLPPGSREVKGQLWLMKEWLVFQPAPHEAAMGMQNVSLALNTVDFVGRGEVDVGRVLQTGLKTPIRVVAGGHDYQFAVDNVDYWVAQVAAQVRAVKGEPQPSPYQPGAAPPPPTPQAQPVPPAPPAASQPPVAAPPAVAGVPIPPAPPAPPSPPQPAAPPAPHPGAAQEGSGAPAPFPPGPVAPPPAPPVSPPPAPETPPAEAPSQVEAATAPATGAEVAGPQEETPAVTAGKAEPSEAAAPIIPAAPEETPSPPAEEASEKKRQFFIAPPPSEPLIPEPPPIPEDLKAAVAGAAPSEAGESREERVGAQDVAAPGAPPEAEVAPEAGPAAVYAPAPTGPGEVAPGDAVAEEKEAPAAAEATEMEAAEEALPQEEGTAEEAVSEEATAEGEAGAAEEAGVSSESPVVEGAVAPPEGAESAGPPEAEAPAEEAAEVREGKEAEASAEETAEVEPAARVEVIGIGHAYYEVSDVVSAAAFYEDVLGLEVEGQKSAQVIWLKAGESRFALRPSGGGTQRGAVVALEVEDIQKAREALRQKGAFPEEILDGPDGERYFYIYDKDRNRIAIWERPKG